jgi:F0F1-type ATP synthase membrane subunit b/b'
MDEVSGVPEQERLIPLPEEGSDAMPDDDDEMVDLAALEASVAGVEAYVEAYLSSIDDLDDDVPPPVATLDGVEDEDDVVGEEANTGSVPPGLETRAGVMEVAEVAEVAEVTEPTGPTDPSPPAPAGLGAFEAIATGEDVELDVPIPPRPEAEDRLTRLESAGAAMRGAIRDEIRGATDHILDSALARARAEITAEVGRFEQDMRRELDVVREDLRRRAAGDRSDAVAERLLSIESRLEDLAGLLEDTREAVLGLRRRYLPSGGSGAPSLPRSG